MMGTMHRRSRLRRRASALALALTAAAVTGCGLLDIGSELEDSFEYLPADTFEVRFAVAGLDDDLDPSDLGRYAEAMADGPFTVDDVEWEAAAVWGDPDDRRGSATVWKATDDADLDGLVEDLEEKGYTKRSVDGRPLLSVELSESDGGLVGGTYPLPLMLNVLVDADEEVVAASPEAAALETIAAVISDDDRSVADDSGFEDLVDGADGDAEVAWLFSAGGALCEGMVGRGLFVLPDDVVRLVLQYGDEEEAEADLEARTALVEDGVDPVTQQPFADLGSFDLERDGDRLVVEEDFDAGPVAALRAEQSRGGPGACPAP